MKLIELIFIFLVFKAHTCLGALGPELKKCLDQYVNGNNINVFDESRFTNEFLSSLKVRFFIP